MGMWVCRLDRVNLMLGRKIAWEKGYERETVQSLYGVLLREFKLGRLNWGRWGVSFCYYAIMLLVNKNDNLAFRAQTSSMNTLSYPSITPPAHPQRARVSKQLGEPNWPSRERTNSHKTSTSPSPFPTVTAIHSTRKPHSLHAFTVQGARWWCKIKS